jgi:O-antigen ligase
MRIMRIGICLVVAFTVFAHGVVEPWSETVLEVAAALLFIYWGVLFALGRVPAVRGNKLLIPVAGLWLFVTFQYLTRLTSVPFLSKVEVLKYSAICILVFLAVQAYETLNHWHGFVWFLLVLGFVVSVVGILQYFTFNGKLYWLRELRYGGVPFGPYVNRNHFAGLVELLIPTGLSVLLLRAEDRDRLPLIGLLTLLPIGALFMSASRGGILAFVVEIGMILVFTFLRREGRNQLVAGATILLIAGAFVAWLGVGPALDRFASYRKLEVNETRRSEMRRDSWRIFVDHPIVGVGFGTLQDVFPRYETLYDGNLAVHAHNDYLEALAETGVIGGLLCAAFLAFLAQEGWARLIAAKNSLDLAFHVGALTACCGLLVHSFVDFNLHIPSNALIFLLQATCAVSFMRASRAAPESYYTRHTGNPPIVMSSDSV